MSAEPTVARRALVASALAGAAVLSAAPGHAAARAPKVTPAPRRWAPRPAQIPAREGLAPSGEARIWYWDTGGDGEPVVLLHPATGSAMIWGYQQPVLARAGYRVIAYSRRGYARTEPGSPDNPGTAVDDLAALLDHLKLERAHLLGSAAGGFTVADFPVSYPDRVISLIFACTQGGVVEPDFRARLAATMPRGFGDMPASFRELGPSYRAGAPEGVAEWEALEQMARGGVRVVQPPKNRLLWPQIESIRAPALVAAGASDLYMPVPLALEYAGHLRAETAVLSECGHSAYWEQPDAFNGLVLDFLRRHRAR